ncbi:MAG: hypothetical protein DWQ36_25675 [Acidobacteria bacterium]|nr:MAG: hypothetical protein DWQ30_17500 [Acidobacteriota bacterium]REJ99405.1 MAG: hypothetical protein DWQ36_25675 [Acidobacteriota bacterium]
MGAGTGGEGGSASRSARQPLPRPLAILGVLWFSLVCGGLVIFGIMTLLGGVGAIALGEPSLARIVAGLLYLGMAAAAFVGLLWFVGWLRGDMHQAIAGMLAELGLRRRGSARSALVNLGGVHFRGTSESGSGIDLHLRPLHRRTMGSRRLRFVGFQIELFLEAPANTRAVVSQPEGAMAQALTRLNRRFGLQEVASLARNGDGETLRRVWAHDPEHARRLFSRPAVASAVDELLRRDPRAAGPPSALHVQPAALLWTARVAALGEIPERLQRALVLLDEIGLELRRQPPPAQRLEEGRWERRSRTDRSSIAWITLGGCLAALCLMLALPLLLGLAAAVFVGSS